MPEAKRSELPMNFDNLLLKQWLHSVGPVRRREVLKKLKEDLQNLGLPRRQVYRGLIQLATRPRVVLERLPSCARSRGPPEGHEKGEIFAQQNGLPRDRSPSGDEEMRKPRATIKATAKEEQGEAKGMNVCKKSGSIAISGQKSSPSSTGCKTKSREEEAQKMFHAFDKALEQFDELLSLKMGRHGKSSGKHTSMIASADTTCKPDRRYSADRSSRKDEEYYHSTCVEEEVTDPNAKTKTPELAHDKVGMPSFRVADKQKRSIKLNLSSSLGKKGRRYSKPESCCRRMDENCMKSDDDKKFDGCKECVVDACKADSIASSNKYAEHEGDADALAGTEYTNLDEQQACKRKSHETTLVFDSAQTRKKICAYVEEHKKLKRKRTEKVRHKFRLYFGDRVSFSEDEEEQSIVEKRLRTKRNKDSVDSCDSGVCVSETCAAASSGGVFKSVEKAVPDSTVHEELDKDPAEQIVIAEKTISQASGYCVVDAEQEEEEEEGEKEETSQEKLLDSTVHEEPDEDVFEKSVPESPKAVDAADAETERIERCQEKVLDDIDRCPHLPDTNVSNMQTSRMSEQLETNGSVVETETEGEVPAQLGVELGGGTEGEAQLVFRPDKGTEDRLELTETGSAAEVQSKLEQEADSNQLEPEAGVETKAEKTVDSSESGKRPDARGSANDTNEHSLQAPENHLDINSISELLRVEHDETSKVASHVTDREGGTDKGIDENGNLMVLLGIVDHIEKNNDTVVKQINLIFDEKGGSTEGISKNIVHDAPCDEVQPLTEESKQSSTDVKDDSQAAKVSQGKLRVLSSAELGSRWCPTPVNNTTPTGFSLTSPVTESKIPLKYTTPAGVSSSTFEKRTVPPVATPVPVPILAPSANKMNVEPIKPVYIACLKVCNLIQNLRISPSISKLDYNKLLFIEFENVRRALKTNNYVALTEEVLCVLNRELLVNPPLSLQELFRYTPSLKSAYIQTSQKLNASANISNDHQNLIPTVMLSHTVPNQNMYCSQQQSQNMMNAMPVQAKLQNFHAASPNTGNRMSANVMPKQAQKNLQEKVILQSQNNFCQSSRLMAVNHPSVQQQTFKIPIQRNNYQQKMSSATFERQKPATSLYAAQGPPPQQSFSSSPMINQLGVKHISAQGTNVPYVQYVPQGVYVPQLNSFYNVNAQSYPVQQNPSSLNVNIQNTLPTSKQYQPPIVRQPANNISQGMQATTMPQMPLNVLPQPVETMYTSNPPNSMPAQKTVLQNTQINQKLRPQVQTMVPRNQVSAQVPSSQHTKNIYSSPIKQPVLAKTKEKAISLESTTKMFDVLKYLSDIQKIMLVKQMEFYFDCVGWLGQKFTSEQWQKLSTERSLLLHFRTLLKHLVEKTVKDLATSEPHLNTLDINVLANRKSDGLKTVQVEIQENGKVHYPDMLRIEQDDITSTNHNCSSVQQSKSVIRVENQTEKQYKEAGNLQNKILSSQSEELGSANKGLKHDESTSKEEITLLKNDFLMYTSDSDIQRNHKNEIGKEVENSMNAQATDIGEPSPNNLEKISGDVTQAAKGPTSVVSDLCNNDALRQGNLHLVTVEVSSNSDQITVIDTNTLSKNNLANQDHEEYVQILEDSNNTLPSSENICEETAIVSPKISDDLEHLNDTGIDNSPSEAPIISYIEDVRSISLQAFEEMEANNVPSNTTEGNIEEEEIKVCLFCGKPSTVACSVCLEAKYCSRTCFKLHWEEHYEDCIPVDSVYL